MLLRGELQKDSINSNFENFESALYMKSVSMPLTLCFCFRCCAHFASFSCFWWGSRKSPQRKENSVWSRCGPKGATNAHWIVLHEKIRENKEPPTVYIMNRIPDGMPAGDLLPINNVQLQFFSTFPTHHRTVVLAYTCWFSPGKVEVPV